LALKASKPSAPASGVAPAPVQQTPASEATPADVPNSLVTGAADAAALVAAAGELPQDHLERMLDGGVPTFVFFHSTTCAQCVEMTGIVDQVYPDFASQVALVDVDVYDDRNQLLLNTAGIRVIPTLIFFDGAGEAQGSTGVMPAEQLREVLSYLAASVIHEP
ncbi:MAG: thioredoxin family protein, partial [Anaerolineae bacterium]|nr:thioredoxin family protein [Anaerolineae bacterium]